MSFANLKKKRNDQFQKLNSQLQSLQGNNFKDDRLWKLDVDKSGNGYAVVRFLPAPDGEDDLFIRVWDHYFKGPGGWYIEKSLTTLGQDDPVSEYNSELWNSGIDANKEIARKQKRKLNFYANIYVVEDPANPENEGKVFLFKFGKKIFDKINSAVDPEFQDEVSFDPFDLWGGANFKIKARNGDGGFRSYDRSEFEAPSKICKPDRTEMTEKEMEEVWKQCHSLKEMIDPSNFKSYDQLKARLTKVLGMGAATTTVDHAEAKPAKLPETPQKSKPTAESSYEDEDDGDDEDEMAFFRQFAEESDD